MKELVSVVITTYGRTSSLKRAIKSVCNQTYENLEILVVDDNNKLELKKEVQEIVQQIADKRIYLISNQANLGGAIARNIGIENARGNYISFLDDDDEYLECRIEKQMELMLNGDDMLGLVYTHCRGIKANKKPIDYCYTYSGNCVFEGMYDCVAATSQWLCRKSALQAVGGFSNVPCKQDSTVIVKLLINGYKIDYVPEILSLYHDDAENRISKQGHSKRILGEEKLRDLCRRNYNVLNKKQIREVEYSFATRLSEHYFAVGDLKNGFICLTKILIRHPIKKQSFGCYKRIFKSMLKRG